MLLLNLYIDVVIVFKVTWYMMYMLVLYGTVAWLLLLVSGSVPSYLPRCLGALAGPAMRLHAVIA